MEDKKYLLVAYVGLFGIIVGCAAYFFMLLPRTSVPNVLLTGDSMTPKGKTEVHLYKKQGSLILNWANLPQGTERVDIFRSVRGTGKWEKWKSFSVAEIGLAGGTITINPTIPGDLDKYSFYSQAVGNYLGGNGSSTGSGSLANGPAGSGGQLGIFTNDKGETVLWISEETEEVETYVPPLVVPPPPTPPVLPPVDDRDYADQGKMIPPIDVPHATSTTGAPGNGSSTAPQTTTPQGTPSGNGNGNQNIYYTPSGEISGYGTEQTKNFWVDHVNRNIELGWQNLPSGTTLVIVYRSQSETSGWAELMRQVNPQSSYTLRLLDNTLDQAHYYKLEARSASEVLQTYGPEFLPALAD